MSKTVKDLFSESVNNNKNKTALVSGNVKISYDELFTKASLIASYLLEKNLTPESPVCILLDRNESYIISILGVILAGGYYIPLDKKFPESRINDIINDSNSKFIIDDDFFRKATTIEISNHQFTEISGHNLCYAIFTSGSTGKPKGVLIEHHSLTNLLNAFENIAPGDSNLICSAVCPFTFDVSVWEIFSALCYGRTLHILDNKKIIYADYFADYIINNNINSLYIPPGMLEPLINKFEEQNKAFSIKRFLTGVEPVKQRVLWRYLSKFNDISIINGYGPTETTICSTFHKFTSVFNPDDNTPIGKEIENYSVRIVDNNLKDTKTGIQGEILIGGAGLARGYLNLPEETEKRFINTEFENCGHKRFYKTGDFGYRLPGGDIMFSGRKDNQIKFRGYRIETEEIEYALNKVHGILEACVLLKVFSKDSSTLVAYYSSANIIEEKIIKIELLKYIPEYMLPVSFVWLNALPRTDSGKVDKKKLLALPIDSVEINEEFLANIENNLLRIWKETLKNNSIKAEDNFFEIGGDSLTAFGIIGKIYSKTGIEISFQFLFNNPTITALANEIKSKLKNKTSLQLYSEDKTYVDNLIPASPGQSRIYFIEELSKGSGLFNIPLFFKIEGRFDILLFEKAINILIAKNESLRTVIINKGGELLQKVFDSYDFKIITEDISNLDSGGQSGFINNLVSEEDKFDFKPDNLPLFRVRVIITGKNKFFLSINIHHIISDNRSVGIFIEKLSKIYNKLCGNEFIDLKPEPVQYADFSIYQNECISGGLFKSELKYWIDTLAGVEPVLQLPVDFTRPKHQTYNGNEYYFELDISLSGKIINYCKENNISNFMFLLSCYAVLISKYSGKKDFIIGVPIANRNKEIYNDVIGMMINNLPIRITIKDDNTYKDILASVKKSLIEAYDNQNLPFEILADSLNLTRDTSHSLLIQTMFNSLTEYRDKLFLKDAKVEIFDFERKKSHLDLTMMYYILESNIKCIFEYNTDIFSTDRIKSFSEHFKLIARSLVSSPEGNIKSFEMISESDIEDIKSINKTSKQFEYKNICDLIKKSAEKNPGKIAVKYADKNLTYKELQIITLKIASILVRLTKGKKSNIALYLNRSESLILGILGVLKSGNCFIPLDPEYPQDRIKYILDVAKPELIITDSKDVPGIDIHELIEGDITDLPVINPSDLAYIIFTSGSTGKPKGVEITHNSLANLIQSIIETAGINESVNLLNVTTYSFDISNLEFFVPLASGGTLVIAGKEDIYDGFLLSEKIKNENISLFQATPATYKILNETGWKGNKGLILFCGGEALHKKLAKELISKCGILYNVYGPTETTIWSSIKKVTEEDIREEAQEYISIGKPLHNNTFYVVDDNFNLLSAGIPGQLLIGGEGVAAGYYGDEKLTNEKFINKNISGNDERFFATGDIVTFDFKGNFHFKERIDSQIKIRGFRIDLSEIEETISKIEGVKEYAVKSFAEAGYEVFIAAYIVMKSNFKLSESEIKIFISKFLPAYMIPSYVVFLEKMPLTPNNKIDRKNLPKPSKDLIAGSTQVKPAVTRTEKIILEIWNNVLKRNISGVNQNFFESGGNSILAMKLISEIETHTGVRLPLSIMFENTTIEKISGIVEKEKSLSWKSLVAIKKTGNKQPLYIIHGAGLNLLLFNTLKELMDVDQPIYGLQASGLDGKTEPLKTVEDMASHYISEITEFDKSGVYSVAGVSFGGIIAYEMAKQFTEKGLKVNFVGLFDAVAYSSNKELPGFKRLLKTGILVIKQSLFAIVNFFEIPFKKKKEFIVKKFKGIARRFGHKQYYEFERRVDVGLGKEEIREIPDYMKKLMETNYKALDNYIISPADVQVTLFKAKLRTFYIEDFKFYGWKKFALKGIDVIEVPGDHNTTFAPPNDKLFAGILQKKLDSREI